MKWVIAGLALAAMAGIGVGGAASKTAGTLQLHGVFHVKWHEMECPEGTPPTTACYSNIGPATFPGLGKASENYVLLVEHADTGCADWRFHVVVTVAAKGSFEADALSSGCFSPVQQVGTTRFTISGGSGVYAGSTGSGTIASAGTETGSAHGIATDTWAGTLAVPGLDFDVTAPTLTGATNRTARTAKGSARAAVRYTLTAQDEVDGALPVTCKPRSGSRFKVGRTKVTCSAVDRSGNTATVTFSVTVRQR